MTNRVSRALPLVALLGLAACGGGSAAAEEPAVLTPTTVAVKGTMTVHVKTLVDAGAPCATSGGYNDIKSGTQVVVTNEAGSTIALGALIGGIGELNDRGRSQNCVFTFDVADVPAGEKFYGVEVSHRGVLQYTEADLAEPIALTLG